MESCPFRQACRAMRTLVALSLAAVLISLGVAAGPWPAGVRAAAAVPQCAVKPGGPERGTPWPQDRLNFQQQAWRVSQGAGVTVAVVDSGVDFNQAQMRGVRHVPGVDVEGSVPTADTRDCYGHGTAVAGIIAAPKVTGVAFVGVAPQATILPIKWINGESDQDATPAGLARGIEAAIARHAQVINISGGTVTDPGKVVEDAVADAARHDVVIVAAAGNDGNDTNTNYYPADYATSFPNLLAVSATDRTGAVAKFSDTGRFVSVAAPGQGIEVPVPNIGYRLDVSGTSFAAPYVAGTAALIRSAFPKLTAEQVGARIKATADPPPAAVPDSRYGYGVVNPNVAVTALRVDSLTTPTPPKPKALPAPPDIRPADRHLQHLALAIGLALLGLAVIAGLSAAVLRRSAAHGRERRRGTRPA